MLKLKKDWIIPAGTEFRRIDGETQEFIEGNHEALLVTSNDSRASFIINDDMIEDNKQYFDGYEPTQKELTDEELQEIYNNATPEEHDRYEEVYQDFIEGKPTVQEEVKQAFSYFVLKSYIEQGNN